MVTGGPLRQTGNNTGRLRRPENGTDNEDAMSSPIGIEHLQFDDESLREYIDRLVAEGYSVTRQIGRAHV